MDLLKNLKWRYATKKFDSTKIVSDENIETIKQVVQLSPSSYGLQLYKVLIIKNKEIREKLKAVSWEQPQVTDASHLIVFCNYTEISEKHIDSFLIRTAKTQKKKEDSLKGYGTHIKANISQKTKKEQNEWTAKQTYLALGNLLISCAKLKIDATPMEGFEPEKYNEILGLSKQGLHASVIAPIGYRSDEDKTQYNPKIRKPLNDLFIHFD